MALSGGGAAERTSVRRPSQAPRDRRPGLGPPLRWPVVARRTNTEVAGLALVAYLPFLLSSPGQVSADSKQALYVDPGDLLARAPDLWDPTTGAGTVPHQQLGYLVPTGPWFWLFEQFGVPDWVAQRLWWGTLSFLAALGARWLFRVLGVEGLPAVAGALVYACTPYQLAFTARISVLLLPWAALPWLVGLTARSCRERSWRWPALLALVLFATGGVNASSLVLVAIGPVLWLVRDAVSGGPRARAALAGGARIGLLAIGVSAWWLVGVRLQGAFGLPVLQLTENLETVARASTPGDVLRGLGNWFFYGRDLTGYSLDQAEDYASDPLVVALTYAVPVVALAAAVVLRWAHRAYFVSLIVVGTIVAVGSWPYHDPSPWGRLWRTFTDDTSLGLALRNSPRAVPLVALGLAGVLAATVAALDEVRWRKVGAVALGVLGLATLLPVWQEGYLTDDMARDEDLPEYWEQAGAALDEDAAGGRVLEIPGSTFAAYDWGTTVDPLTPLLIDRPYAAREVLPDGTPASVNLLAALDRRLQLGTFEPEALAPVARLMGAGTVALRADLEQSERFEHPDVESLWSALLRAPGLGPPVGFGPPGGTGEDPDLSSVTLFGVDDAVPIVRTAPARRPVLLAGDGDGIVDAAAAGIIDGRSLVLYGTALDDASLDTALESGADLVLTDSHRRRIETWFYSIKDTRGPTERAGEVQPDPTGYDFRLDPFPGSTDDSRTVAQHIGGTAVATMAGGPERPEERAVHAFDGDVDTSWRVGGDDPRGESITLTLDQPVEAGEVRLVQALTDGRQIARVAIHADDREPVVVDLDDRSRQPGGQAVPLPGAVSELTVEILETSPPSPTIGDGTPVGFAEIRLGDVVVEETIRLPVDLLDRVGPRLGDHGLDIVLTRLQAGSERAGRPDEEPYLDRTFELPVGRTFEVEGVVEGPADPQAGAPGLPCRSDLLELDGEPLPVRLSGSTFVGCEPLELGPGSHRVRSLVAGPADGAVNRLVLSSGPDDEPPVTGPRGESMDAAPPFVVTTDEPGHVEVEVGATAGEPFWLVLGQSHSDGWSIDVDGGGASDRQLVDGGFNGWLVTPDGEAVTVSLRWKPQRLVPIGLVVSVGAVVACAVIVLRTRRRAAPSVADGPTLWLGLRDHRLSWRRTGLATVVVAGLGLLVASPSVALVAGVLTAVTALWPPARLGLGLLASIALAVSRFDIRPQLAWLAVLLVVAVVVTDGWRSISGPDAPGSPAP